MGMPAALEHRWTATEVRALPNDGMRHEVIGGELLVSPGPAFKHQRVTFAFWRILDEYLRNHRAGDVLGGPAEIEVDPHTLVQPDIFVLPLAAGRVPDTWEDVRRLLLAVEVLSPGTSRIDRRRKRETYLAMGAEYWIVDPDARLVERWLPAIERPEILVDELAWRAPDADETLRIELQAVFAHALDR
jgi:Uma2 family endonuclease